MKHAGPGSLDVLEPLLEEIRKHKALKEKKRGVFYRGATAFLHFHEDPAGLFADLRAEAGWVRLPVNTRAERARLASRVAELAS
jgi:hypothetical protein